MTVVEEIQKLKQEKNSSYSGTLLCETGDSGHCGLHRRFFLSE